MLEGSNNNDDRTSNTDLEDMDEGDQELRTLYGILYLKFKEKGKDYVQVAKSKSSGNIRYLIQFHHGSGMKIVDLETKEIVTVE